jgi:hypothetical protein
MFELILAEAGSAHHIHFPRSAGCGSGNRGLGCSLQHLGCVCGGEATRTTRILQVVALQAGISILLEELCTQCGGGAAGIGEMHAIENAEPQNSVRSMALGVGQRLKTARV